MIHSSKIKSLSTISLALVAAWAVVAKLTIVPRGEPVDILLYFTIQSNILVALYMGLRVFLPEHLPRWSHGAVTLYILITGVVYNVLLAPTHHPVGYDNFNNILLHMVVPAWMVVDWVFTQDRKSYKLSDYWIWMIYPFLYAIFGSLEGLFTGNFRYFFLDFVSRPLDAYLIVMAIVFTSFFAFGGVLFFLNRTLGAQSKEQ